MYEIIIHDHHGRIDAKEFPTKGKANAFAKRRWEGSRRYCGLLITGLLRRDPDGQKHTLYPKPLAE